jgi:hypothetical protein
MLTTEKIDVLKRLQQLKTDNLLSDEEYELERARLLRHEGRTIDLISSLTNLLKVALWPFVILLLIALFQAPIRQKLSDSQEIAFASFRLKVNERARLQGNEELAKVISTLSKDALVMLLNIGSTSRGIAGSDRAGTGIFVGEHDFLVYRELESHGLLKADEPLNGFWEFLLSLKPETETTYRSLDGRTSCSTRSEEHPLIDHVLTFGASELSLDSRTRLLDAGVRLTDRGLLAFNLIVQVLGEQLSTD